MLSAPVEGGVIRRLPMVFGLGDKLVPSLPLEMLRLATGSSAIDVFADGAGVQGVGVADVTVPTQADGDIWLHFASIRATRNRYVSARDILDGKVDPERIRDKLVLVGLTGAGLADMRTTALGELVPGIEIQAQAIETVFEGRFLRRPVWLKWAESSFILVFGLLITWYVPRTGSRRLAVFMRAVPKASAVLGIVLNLLLLSLSFLVFVRLGLLVDATSIFIVLSAVMSCFFRPTCSMRTKRPGMSPRSHKAKAPTPSAPPRWRRQGVSDWFGPGVGSPCRAGVASSIGAALNSQTGYTGPPPNPGTRQGISLFGLSLSMVQTLTVDPTECEREGVCHASHFPPSVRRHAAVCCGCKSCRYVDTAYDFGWRQLYRHL